MDHRIFFVPVSFLCLLLLGVSLPSHAFIITNDEGFVEYSVRQLDQPLDWKMSPFFGDRGDLISPGLWYPSSIGTIGPVSTTTGDLTPFLDAQVPMNMDSSFGDAFISLEAHAGPLSAGIFWTEGFVVDFDANDRASANVSGGILELENEVAGNLVGGAYLSVFGRVAPGGYVAASLTGSINDTPFDPIIIASDGYGWLGDGVWSAGGGILDDTFFSQRNAMFGQNPMYDFEAFGIDILHEGVLGNFDVGDPIVLQGTLSLFADPDSFIALAALPQQSSYPTYRLNAYTSIPEPSSMMLLLLGLISLFFAGKVARIK